MNSDITLRLTQARMRFDAEQITDESIYQALRAGLVVDGLAALKAREHRHVWLVVRTAPGVNVRGMLLARHGLLWQDVAGAAQAVAFSAGLHTFRSGTHRKLLTGAVHDPTMPDGHLAVEIWVVGTDALRLPVPMPELQQSAIAA